MDSYSLTLFTSDCRGNASWQLWEWTDLGQIRSLMLKSELKKDYTINNNNNNVNTVVVNEAETANLCIEAFGEGMEVKLTPCKDSNAAQQWQREETNALWVKTVNIRSLAFTSLCLTPSLYPYVRDDPPDVRTYQCAGVCKQVWQDAAVMTPTVRASLFPKENPDTAYPRKQALQKRQPRNEKGRRIACWAMTNPLHRMKAQSLHATWGRLCDVFFYVSVQAVPGVDTLVMDLGQPDDREMLWRKSKAAWMYLYDNYLDDADWFVRADDGELSL